MLLVKSAGPDSIGQWRAEFARHLPELDVRWWDEPGIDPLAVRYTLVWQPTPGRLATFRNLRAIFSSGAGVDHIVQDTTCPTDVPLVRMGADELGETMAEFIAMSVLMLMRDQPRMARAQAARTWAYFEPPRTARETRVGILGLGAMGARAATLLRVLGFEVSGWSRRPKSIAGLTCLHGASGLETMLATSHILVCLLPETPQTRHLVGLPQMQAMPQGASIINVGRGSAVVLPDLLTALRSGQIHTAVLDVLDDEPPGPDHPAWSHERLLLTPHVAGYARIPAKAAYVAKAIRDFEAGGPLPNLYDRARGY
jgi:glyoxylate/hydroxypyruvate reductase